VQISTKRKIPFLKNYNFIIGGSSFKSPNRRTLSSLTQNQESQMIIEIFKRRYISLRDFAFLKKFNKETPFVLLE